MADDANELFDAPVACEETTEYDNRIEDEIEVESEEEEPEERLHTDWAGIEQQFARYERNYRARRIRELTLAPVKKRGARRAGSTATGAAA